jgi:hypothetical protein
MLIKILELKLDYNSFRSLVASIVLVSIATFFVTFSYSFTKQSFSFSTYEISFSHSKTNNVFVKPSEGVQLLHLREISKKNGLNSSTPLINLASPGYSYFLGANVPNSSHLTFFDREKSIDLFKFQVYKSNQSFNYSNAWILRFAPQFGSSLANYQSIQALKIIENVSHLKFPDNYVLIYSDASLQLWKPLPSSFKYNNLNSINVSRYPLEVSRHYR